MRVFAFKNEQEFDDANYAGHLARSQNRGPGRDFIPLSDRKIFAKITSLVAGTDGKQAKGSQAVYNKTTHTYEVPTPAQWIFDSDNLSNDYTTTDIYSNASLSVDEIVEVIQMSDSTGEESINIARKNGGSSLYYVEITGSTNISTYTATIYSDPINRTLIESGITVRAMKHDAGTLPNSAAGKGLSANKIGGVYFLLDYSVFHAS